MRGGTSYRYFQLLDEVGDPIPDASVIFSAGGSTSTEAEGYFTFSVAADDLGAPGSYPISVQSVISGPQTYITDNQPSFNVEVTNRTYAHSWSYGAIRRASGGVGMGLVAYVNLETNGGLGLTLEESDPLATSDDRVLMEESYSAEVSGEVGVGIRQEISAGPLVDANLDLSITTSRGLRAFGNLLAGFEDPYADADRKAQGIFLALSVLDSVTGSPTQPIIVAMLREAEVSLPYLDYIEAQKVGYASEVTPVQANVGADFGLGASLPGGAGASLDLVGFRLVDVGISRLTSQSLTDYGNEYSVTFDSGVSIEFSGLSLQAIGNSLGAVIGDHTLRIQKEYFYDPDTDQLLRIELTLIGEGNPAFYTDVTKKQVSTTCTISGASLTPSLVEVIGEAELLADLDDLFSSSTAIPCVVEVQDGSSASVVPELDIPNVPISIGLGIEVESLRDLVAERHVFLNGQDYLTEAYSADSYVSTPGKSWVDLTENALGGLWLVVKDIFNWISKTVTSGAEWFLDVIAESASDVLLGTARFDAPSGALFLMQTDAGLVDIPQEETIEVTGIGWAPEDAPGAGGLAQSPLAETASGSGFVVGGVYDFQPETYTLSQAATLTITYTEAALVGKDENQMGLFRWNAEENNWQAVTAQADLANNTFTASVTQLGTYGLGYDGTPPLIDILSPTDGENITNTLPLLTALVADEGVGIDPDTVEMQLDGQVVDASYISDTGQLMYLPETPLQGGMHTLTVSAYDVLGNGKMKTTTFSIGGTIYLPLIMK
jgi:hypothetical protein